MAYLKLDLVKKHLNIEPDYALDDAYIESLIQVAEVAVECSVNEKLSIIAGKNGGQLPSPLIQAMLLLIGNYYQNRETVAPQKTTVLPYNFQFLIDMYKNYNK